MIVFRATDGLSVSASTHEIKFLSLPEFVSLIGVLGNSSF